MVHRCFDARALYANDRFIIFNSSNATQELEHIINSEVTKFYEPHSFDFMDFQTKYRMYIPFKSAINSVL